MVKSSTSIIEYIGQQRQEEKAEGASPLIEMKDFSHFTHYPERAINNTLLPTRTRSEENKGIYESVSTN